MPLPRRPLGATFVVAVAVLSFFAVVQLGAFIFHYIPVVSQHFVDAHRVAESPAPQRTLDKPYRPGDEVGEEETPRPTPAPTTHQADAIDPVLLEQASQLAAESDSRYRVGMHEEALTLLEQAQKILPRDPGLQYRLGRIRKAMGEPLEAILAFQSALTFPGLTNEARREIQNEINFLSENVSVPKIPEMSGEEAFEFGEGGRDEDGLQPGCDLGIVAGKTGIHANEEDPAKKDLRIAIKSRPVASISPEDIVAHVFFYERDDSGEIVPTTTRVEDRWAASATNLASGNPAVLDVTYTSPPPETGQVYYGYSVAIYYRGALQDVAAQPQDLLNRYKPPLLLEEE